MSNGTLTLSGTNGLSFSVGSGTNSPMMVFTGTLADINPALNGLRSSRPRPTTTARPALTMNVNDLGNSGSGGALIPTRR